MCIRDRFWFTNDCCPHEFADGGARLFVGVAGAKLMGFAGVKCIGVAGAKLIVDA